MWSPSTSRTGSLPLAQIALLGFEKLKATVSKEVIDGFASEAAGSPQLMQSICLQACLEMEMRDELPRTREIVIVPERVKKRDRSEGDVYRCILRAIAADPPQLSFDYSEILRRVEGVYAEQPPVGSSITSSCLHMSKLACEKLPDEKVLG